MEKSLSNLFAQATAPARQKKAEQNRKIWVPEFSRFKLQFIHRNGQHSTPYHSYDIHKGKDRVNITDEAVGYSKLLLLVESRRSQDNYVVATIWANLSDDLRTYVDGRMNMKYDFIVFKHVRGQNPYVHPLMQFPKGRLNADQLLQAYLSRKGSAA